MKNNKYKIVVLSDLKKSAESELKSTVSLAQMIDGDITLFHVIKPTEIVERESQLSAMRSINEEHVSTRKKIEKLIQPISKDFNLVINHDMAIGNVKHEIETYLNKYQPDVIVLGKRKSKTPNFMGDNITEFILKTHHGVIMIAAEEHALQPNTEGVFGVLNTTGNSTSSDFFDSLVKKTKHPLKSFKINKRVSSLSKTEGTIENSAVEYVFEEGDSALDNISKYASKSRINLMCFNDQEHDKTNKNIKNVINKLNVSLLLTGIQTNDATEVVFK